MEKELRRRWWRDAKFGLFIHWGIYSIPAKGEWDMLRSNVPSVEYRKYAEQFNPVKFNAKEWVQIAKNAGMKYMVFTSKHHDGFSMFDTAVSDYSITEATPFGRDVMKELSTACGKNDLKFGVYYSHAQDWAEENGGGKYFELKPQEERDYSEYFYKKCYPQLQEILTKYGTIWELYLDTPVLIRAEHAQIIEELVRKAQPLCMLDSRIGPGDFDYQSLVDNTIPSYTLDNAFEVPATITQNWGYMNPEFEPTPLKSLLGMLCDIVGMGGNYLLNVGPRPDGTIQENQAQRLKEMGDWLEVHGDAIYGSGANPYDRLNNWGTITTKGNKMNLIFFEKPEKNFKIYGLKNKVKKAYWIHNSQEIEFEQSIDTVELKNIAGVDDDLYPIAVLECDDKIEVNVGTVQQDNDELLLETVHASYYDNGKRNPNKRPPEELRKIVCAGDAIWNSLHVGMTLEWEAEVKKAGTYLVECVEFGGNRQYDSTQDVKEPHIVELIVDGDSQRVEITNDYSKQQRFNHMKSLNVSRCAKVTFDKPGKHIIQLNILEIAERTALMNNLLVDKRKAFIMDHLKLTPIEE